MNQREQEALVLSPELHFFFFFFLKLLLIITIISLKLTAEHIAEVTITFSRGPVLKMLWHGSVADFLVWALKLQTKPLTLSCLMLPSHQEKILLCSDHEED